MMHNGKHIDDMTMPELRNALRDLKRVLIPGISLAEGDEHMKGKVLIINLEELKRVCE